MLLNETVFKSFLVLEVASMRSLAVAATSPWFSSRSSAHRIFSLGFVYSSIGPPHQVQMGEAAVLVSPPSSRVEQGLGSWRH